MSTAYEQGREAFRKDGSSARNPFPFPDVAQSCDHREKWQMGFRDASPNPFRFPWKTYPDSVRAVHDADGKLVCETKSFAIAEIIVAATNVAYHAFEPGNEINKLIMRLEHDRATV